MTIGKDWYDVVITVIDGHITVTWDGVKVIDYTDPDPLPPGDIFIQNWDNMRYELDFLEVSPPDQFVSGGGAGQTVVPASTVAKPTRGIGGSVAAPTDTPDNVSPPPVITPILPSSTPPPSSGGERPPVAKVIDLSVSNLVFGARGKLLATIVNNGPDSYVGNLDVDCTIWYGGTEPHGIGGVVSLAFTLEPGQGQEVQTYCSVDNSQGPLLSATVVIPDLPMDPNPVNNWMSIEP